MTPIGCLWVVRVTKNPAFHIFLLTAHQKNELIDFVKSQQHKTKINTVRKEP